MTEGGSDFMWPRGDHSCRGTRTECVSVPLQVSVTLRQCEGQHVRLTVRTHETMWLKACVTRIVEGVMVFLCVTAWLRV